MSALPRVQRHEGFVADLEPDESLSLSSLDGKPLDLPLGQAIRIIVEHKKGQRSRIRVVAPRNVVITRLVR